MPSRKLCLLLMGGIWLSSGCTPKPPPPTDSRSCYVGLLPELHVVQARGWAPQARAGDLLINPSCDAEETERLLNDVRRQTH